MRTLATTQRIAGPSTHHDGAGADRWILPAIAILAIVGGASIVFSGSLAYFFAQDDFHGLARAREVLPRLSGPWRYVSGQIYFDLMGALAGLDPRPYRIGGLLAHLATATLVVLWLRPRVAWPAAALGALFFATHPALFTALYSISGIGEILALFFGMAALLLARHQGPTAWLALPCLALSVLSKESTLLLPLVAWADTRLEPPAGSRARTPRLPVLIGLAAISGLYLPLFLAGDVFGIRASLPESAPYSLAFDGTLVSNALTYLGWSTNFWIATVTRFSDAIDPGVYPFGIAALLLFLIGCFWADLRRRGWLLGGIAFACFLIPVLPLRNHTYHYYLYGPLAGAALVLAAGASALLARIPRRESGAPAWVAASVLGAALVWNGALLVRKIEHYPFVVPTLRSDSTVDRALIAGHVVSDLTQASLPPGARLVFWSPIAIGLAHSSGMDTTGATYFETNVRNALADGLAIRLFFPNVTGVEFVRDYRPLGNGEHYAIYRPDGRVHVVDEAGLQALLSTMPRLGP